MNRVLIPPLTARPVRPTEATLIELSGPTMGTSWRVRGYAPADVARTALQQRIEEALGRVIDQMSSWAPHSVLSQFNALLAGESIALPEDFEAVLACALRIAEETNGAFDPTIGALVDLWGFGANAPAREIPLDADLEEARAHAGWRKLEIVSGRLTQPGGLHLDFSGVAKGYAVDVVAETLREAGVQSLLVEIGGELVGRGVKPDGQPWWVELEEPPGAATPRTLAALHNLAIATSGDYRRSATVGGERIAHTIDPTTGRPLANNIASVSVLHASCMEADAYATALTVLGGARAVAFADTHGLAMRCLERSADGFLERRSRAFEMMLDEPS